MTEPVPKGRDGQRRANIRQGKTPKMQVNRRMKCAVRRRGSRRRDASQDRPPLTAAPAECARCRVSALVQGQLDAFHEQIMDFAPLVERDLPQRRMRLPADRRSYA